MSPRGIAVWSRETRLLLLTIAVALGALVILARFRFPAERPLEAPAPQPLERLAARATYDELASIVQRVERRIAPSLLVLQTGAVNNNGPRTLRSVLDPVEPVGSNQTFVLGLRIQPDIAAIQWTPGLTIEGLLGAFEAVPILIAEDPLRQVALVRVPAPPEGSDWRAQPVDQLTVPRYVVAVEASRGGITPRPVFLGRADRIHDPRWNATLLVLARTPVTAVGSFVFTLEGQLVGLVSSAAGLLTIVPGDALTSAADRLLETGSPSLTDLGLTLAPFDGDRVKAETLINGVVVHEIAPGSRADNVLQVGDVIHAVNGRAALTPDSVLLQIAQIPAAAPIALVVRRGDETLTLTIP